MEIRRAIVEEKEEIINFIKMNWKEDHIFVLDKDFFDYFYREDFFYNIIVAKEKNEIKAILGYIKYSSNSNEIFLALWKSIKNSMAGIKCLEFLMENYKVSCCGINKRTIPIYNFFNMNTGKLKHFYKLNTNIKEYKIAKILSKPPKIIDEFHVNLKERIIEIFSKKDLEEIVNYHKFEKNRYYKSIDYFNKIYFENPYYSYIILGLKNKDEEIDTLIVLREVIVKNRKCLRIIDIIGEESLLFILNEYINEKFTSGDYEYIDIYEIGLEDETLLNMGFIERKEKDENIIPNYFEPFEQKNIEVYYVSSYKEKFKMFKGDGDQDRPSIVKSKVN